MSSGVKLTVGSLGIAIAIGYLAFLGANTSWQYYLSVDEVVIDAAHLVGKRLRVSGRVAVGSVEIRDDRRKATFDLRGQSHDLRVVCQCAIPDNFAENIDVVVEGKLENDRIHGRKIITRCASKYNQAESTASATSSTETSTSKVSYSSETRLYAERRKPE
jgi:cytochrome c-type biogenesis protein CcmE